MPGKGKGMSKSKGKGNDGMHGRSESSPGHLKQGAGAESARDYAPGRAGKTGRATALPESAPDEIAED